jgi:hypothetical protein
MVVLVVVLVVVVVVVVTGNVVVGPSGMHSHVAFACGVQVLPTGQSPPQLGQAEAAQATGASVVLVVLVVVVVVVPKKQAIGAVLELRGTTDCGEKSFALSSVSRHPLSGLTMEVPLFATGAAGDPSEQSTVPPQPTKSMTLIVGQLPLSAVVDCTSASFPPVTAMLVNGAVASGVGRGTPTRPGPSAWMR